MPTLLTAIAWILSKLSTITAPALPLLPRAPPLTFEVASPPSEAFPAVENYRRPHRVISREYQFPDRQCRYRIEVFNGEDSSVSSASPAAAYVIRNDVIGAR